MRRIASEIFIAFAQFLAGLGHPTCLGVSYFGFSGFAAMVFGNFSSHRLSILAEGFTRITAQFGSPKGLFTGVYLLSLFTFQDKVAGEMLTLTFVWVMIVFGQPAERTVVLYRRLRRMWSEVGKDSPLIGPVALRREPGLATISVSTDTISKCNGQLILIPTNNSYGELGIIIDTYRLSDQVDGRAH